MTSVKAHPQSLDAVVDHVDHVGAAAGISIVRLRLPSGAAFAHEAGQYAVLEFAGQAPRPYSIASMPGEETVSFHIRNLGHGASAQASHLKPGDVVRLSGPFGTGTLRKNCKKPIVAIAGGVGLVPLRAIVAQALRSGHENPIHLYVGARGVQDLYLKDELESWQARWPHLRVVYVLSDEDRPGYRHGLVGEVAVRDLSAPDACRVYLSGPAAMVAATLDLLGSCGVPPGRIHYDAEILRGVQTGAVR